MASDPVAEALRVACEWMHANCGEAESVEAWRYDAAGVIAAFLDGYAAACRKRNPNDGQAGFAAYLAREAERAAREGRDGG